MIYRLLVYTAIAVSFWGCQSNPGDEGDALLQQDKYDEAIAAYSKYLADHPKDDRLLANRANAYYKRGMALKKTDSVAKAADMQKAVADYQAAASIRKDNTDYWSGLAAAHLELRNLDAAISAASSAIEINPNAIRAYFIRAKAYERLVPAKTVSARADYNKIISLDPKNAEAYLMLGVMEGKMGKLEEACKLVSKAAELGHEMGEKAKQKYCKK